MILFLQRQADKDDIALSTKQVTIPADQKQATFAIQAIDDDIFEDTLGHEQFNVIISSIVGAELDPIHQSVKTSIVDNESLPFVSLTTETPVIVEGS